MTEPVERILVVGPAWVGDMVMAQSLFKLLKCRKPDACIDVVAPSWTLPLVERMPEVEDAILMPLAHGELGLRQRWRLGHNLRKRRYDRAIVLPRSFKSAILPFAAKAKRRTGFLGELRWGLLNDVRRLDKSILRRTVDRFNELALDPGEKDLPSPPRPLLEASTENAAAVLNRLGWSVPIARVLGLCPGAEYGRSKRWPPEQFAEVANVKLDGGWQVWLFGSDKDAAITHAVQAMTHNRCLDLGGRTQLGEVIDLMALTTAVVSNDSGLMHVATGLGRNIISIYGSSDPGFTPPLSDTAKVLRTGIACSPCFKRECPYGHYRCLTELKADRVLGALAEL